MKRCSAVQALFRLADLYAISAWSCRLPAGTLRQDSVPVKNDMSLFLVSTPSSSDEDTPRSRGAAGHGLSSLGLKSVALATTLGLLAGCQPTVRVEAPKEPITINLNVKLDAEVRLKLEEQAREEVEANPDIF